MAVAKVESSQEAEAIKKENEKLKLRNSRQEALAPLEKLKASDCVVIGAGAVGRNVCKLLASMGVNKLQIWDHDTVEMENLAPQGYNENQLKKNKAEATGEDCISLNSNLAKNITVKNRRFAKSDAKALAGKHVFMCVDSIDTRKNIYEAAVKSGANWIGDARVAGEIIRVISESKPEKDGKYSKTLFEQSEAYEGSCHQKMVNYGAYTASGALVGKFAQSLREVIPSFSDHNLNMMGWDLFETEEPKS